MAKKTKKSTPRSSISRVEKAYTEGGNIIEAIKHYRDRTGASLYDSKKAIDNYRELLACRRSGEGGDLN